MASSNSFTTERLMGIAQELVDLHVKAVVLIGGGEPLAHPAAGKLIRFLGEHDVRIGITTNGYFIPRYMEEIAEYSSWTRISMDAATSEMFQKLRPAKDGSSKFEYIVQAMRDLAKVKKGTLGFSYLIRTEADGFGLPSNIGEIYDAALLARDIGCDYFEVKPSYAYVGGQPHALVKHTPERMAEARREVARLEGLDTEIFKVIRAITLEDSLHCVETPQEKNYHFCPAAHLRTLICPSGVYVCPYWRGKTPFRIGNAQEEHLAEIWHGEHRASIMKDLDPTVKCQFHCLRNETNQEIIRLMGMERKDIEEVAEYDRFI